MSVQSMKKIMQLGNQKTRSFKDWLQFSFKNLSLSCLFEAKSELSKSTSKLSVNQLNIDNDEFVQRITTKFNDSIVFKPDQLRMAYTIRDPIINRKHTLLISQAQLFFQINSY